MQLKPWIRGTALVVSFVWSLAIALNGLAVDDLTQQILGFVPLVLVLLFTAWDNWLWHLKIFLPLAKRPDLRGTWLGSFEAQWLDDKFQLHESTAPMALVINQSFTQLSVVLVAEKSKSYSLLAHVQQLPSGEYQINYEYSNTPAVKFRSEMSAHSGSTQFVVTKARSDRLSGEYWTNRWSRGSLQAQWVSKTKVSDLAQAQSLPPNPTGRS